MKGIRIVSKVDGFRRVGIAHHGIADYPISAFTKAQLDQLKAEPNLVVQEIDLPDEDKPVKAGSGRGQQLPA